MQILNQTEHKMSERYTLAKTQDIIDIIEPQGFIIDNVQTAHVKKQENQGFQKHLVTLKSTEYESSEGVPTILIQNSYNGSSGIKVMTGYIRFACSNGLIIGTGIESLNMRHKRDWEQPIHKFLEEYASTVAQKAEERQMMLSQYLSSYQQLQFAERAVELRYSLKDIMDIAELNLTRRIEDRGKNVWITYNRIQESLINGLFTRRIQHEEQENWSQARRLTNIDEITRVNNELYNIALEYV